MNQAEAIDRIEALPDTYADRIPEPQLSGLRSMARGGEWEELLEALVAGLHKRQPPVTSAERDELATLLTHLQLPVDQLDRLNVTQP